MDKIIQYKNHTFIQYISNKKIDEKCKQIALEINKKYNNQSILIVGVLNGCFPFMSSLLKYITVPYEYEFIKISSYSGTKSEDLKIHIELSSDKINAKNILLIEDIVDSGKTLEYIKNNMLKFTPNDFKIVSLLTKEKNMKIIDWYGFIIDDKFVIGYGMDIDGKYRDLKNIYIENEEKTK